jgi:hypothetical protein
VLFMLWLNIAPANKLCVGCWSSRWSIAPSMLQHHD